jgi:arginine N-succinyltransferase
MSYVLRPVREEDIEDVTRLAMEATSGITSLPKNPHLLQRKILKSLEHFQLDVHYPVQEFYLFVLEETATRRCIGVSGIYSKTGVTDAEPLFWYKIEELPTNRALPEMLDFFEILRPVQEVNGPTEICALFLDAGHRKEGLGKLLSFGRFMFIADHLPRFEETIFANMRGMILPNDVSPFWDAIGRRFCDISFLTLMNMLHHNRSFITSLIPPFPIFISLLPTDVQQLIGMTHPATAPALNLLLREGFAFTKKIDPFDGGPVVAVPTLEIKTVKESQVALVASIADASEFEGGAYLISNRRPNFRCCIGTLKMNDSGEASLPRAIAEALDVHEGDSVRVFPLKRGSEPK